MRTPTVYYVDYKEHAIYMEYIQDAVLLKEFIKGQRYERIYRGEEVGD